MINVALIGCGTIGNALKVWFQKNNPKPICEENSSIKDASLLNNDDFKRFLCDVLNCNYHISNENLLNAIKEKI